MCQTPCQPSWGEFCRKGVVTKTNQLLQECTAWLCLSWFECSFYYSFCFQTILTPKYVYFYFYDYSRYASLLKYRLLKLLMLEKCQFHVFVINIRRFPNHTWFEQYKQVVGDLDVLNLLIIWTILWHNCTVKNVMH